MKYVTPTAEIQVLRTEDIVTISISEIASYGSSVGFWQGTEEDFGA
ncbi:MAG: hypothetical protein IJ011_09760 [Clostridia bacterium]|nr:hypothetical protein [Clostridia bacterium]